MRLIRIAFAIAVLCVPAMAAAHGDMDHAGHGAPQAAAGTLALEGYQVDVVTEPTPLSAGRDNRIVAKIVEAGSSRPVAGGTVHITLAGATGAAITAHATEAAWAGSYAATFRPDRAGPHDVRVTIEGLDGRRFDPPLTVDVRVDVARASLLGGPMWWTLALVSGIAVVAVYAVRLRATDPAQAAGSLNLLAIPWLRRILTSRFFQPALQIPLLAVTAFVVYVGFVDVEDGGINLATKLTWTIWWAGVIFTFVLAGRVWCVACPFGALNEWTAGLSGAWRRLPRLFRNIWWATALFVALTWADELLGVVRSPRTTAWIIVGFAALAVAVGLRYERRSFCRHLCPIGGLIGIYSMTAPVELRAKDASVCRAHGDKECYRGGAHARGCPMFEFPQTLDRNNYCTFCGACVTSCSRDNLVLRFRAFGKDLWAARRRAFDEAYLAAALVGLTLLVTAEMLPAWSGWMSALARWLPGVVRSALKPLTYLTAVESVVLLGGSLLVAPLLILVAAAIADRLAGAERLGLRRTFVLFGYMFVPIGLAMHLAHNLSHLLMEGGGIVPVVQRAIALYTPWSAGEPDWQSIARSPESVVALLQMTVLVALFIVSLLAGHRLSLRAYPDRRAAGRALVPFVALALFFTAIGIALLNQPMGMRHGM
jgi:ferredoxin